MGFSVGVELFVGSNVEVGLEFIGVVKLSGLIVAGNVVAERTGCNVSANMVVVTSGESVFG